MSFRLFAQRARRAASQFGLAVPMARFNDAVSLAFYGKKYSPVIAAESAGVLAPLTWPPPHLGETAEVLGFDRLLFSAVLELAESQEKSRAHHLSSMAGDGSRVLDEIGLVIDGGSLRLRVSNEVSARSASFHRTRRPVVSVGMSLADPSIAASRFGNDLFLQMLERTSALDIVEKRALALVCRSELEEYFWLNPTLFNTHLRACLDKYGLWTFFGRFPSRRALPHHEIRPFGFDWADPHCPELPDKLDRWRRDFTSAPIETQLWAASVLMLYSMRQDLVWLKQVPREWRVMHVMAVLEEHGSLADWGRLVALYPGW
jgi:hypothetical protein